MFKNENFFVYLLIMAGVTYLLRLLPMLIFRDKINNRFIRSFLYYIPYSVLTVMAVPAILFSTNYIITGAVAMLTAIVLAYAGRSLIAVSAGTATAVLISEFIISLI